MGGTTNVGMWNVEIVVSIYTHFNAFLGWIQSYSIRVGVGVGVGIAVIEDRPSIRRWLEAWMHLPSFFFLLLGGVWG